MEENKSAVEQQFMFNGDRLEIAKSELENHVATVYHRRHDGQIETLFGRIIECLPESIRFRTILEQGGQDRDLRGENITNWIIGPTAKL